jgi:hypothetical protein
VVKQKYSNFELKKQSEWWLTLSHIIIGATIAKLVELFQKPSSAPLDFIYLLALLSLSLLCARVGFRKAHEIKDD